MAEQKPLVRLEDIIPEPAEFTLSLNKKTYHLRPVSLADEIWLRKTFGDAIEKVFSELRMDDVCRIIFRLLSEEEKQEFKLQKVIFVDEDGQEREEMVGGYNLLMKMLVGGPLEKLELVKALLKTIGASRVANENPVQKKTPKLKKTIGPRS